MKRIHRVQWLSIFLLASCLTACQVKRPKMVLSDAKMENVLYDYHIAKAMGEEIPYNESYKRLLYIESVFKKHGITQADFDSSMVWFTRNPDVLTKVYEKVNVRLKAEREGINHLISIRDNKPKESLPGDSIDVWAWQRIYQLTGMPLDNKITFVLPADTNFKDRDTLRWNMRFRFHNGAPDSMYAPIMSMQIVYKNDSIISNLLKVYRSGEETIALHSDTLGEIKEIRGSIYYPAAKATRTLLADRILLMRYHATDTLTFMQNDSIRAEKKVEMAETKKEELKPADGQKEERENDNTRRRDVARPRPASAEPKLRQIDKPEKLQMHKDTP